MNQTIKMPGDRPGMIAHRGLSGLERENTCAAFVAAGNHSYYGIETDIHRTKDGRYIVFHDDDLTRLLGDERIVEEMTFSELRALRLTDHDGREREDLMLPSLEEYIRICRKYNKESVLEIKNHFAPEDLDRVIGIIQAEGWLGRTIFISFDLPNCLCLREKLPEQRIQYLVEVCDAQVLQTLKEYRLDLDMDYQRCTRDIVDACHAMGRAVNVWTVNEPEDGRRLAGYGVDFITSNILE
ncbi:MAG: hypothetical protein II888_05880 [Clostridia bacterium]|nr:hypothetical protein [Clostridia bacterium]